MVGRSRSVDTGRAAITPFANRLPRCLAQPAIVADRPPVRSKEPPRRVHELNALMRISYARDGKKGAFEAKNINSSMHKPQGEQGEQGELVLESHYATAVGQGWLQSSLKTVRDLQTHAKCPADPRLGSKSESLMQLIVGKAVTDIDTRIETCMHETYILDISEYERRGRKRDIEVLLRYLPSLGPVRQKGPSTTSHHGDKEMDPLMIEFT